MGYLPFCPLALVFVYFSTCAFSLCASGFLDMQKGLEGSLTDKHFNIDALLQGHYHADRTLKY